MAPLMPLLSSGTPPVPLVETSQQHDIAIGARGRMAEQPLRSGKTRAQNGTALE
jgi:hypothetical protein